MINNVVLLFSTTNRGGSRIFLRRGCTRLLPYFNTNKPHSFFFCRIPVVLENRRSSQGGGEVRTPCTLPLDPPLTNEEIHCEQLLQYWYLSPKRTLYSLFLDPPPPPPPQTHTAPPFLHTLLWEIRKLKFPLTLKD